MLLTAPGALSDIFLQLVLACVICVGSAGLNATVAEEDAKSDTKEKAESKDKDAEKPVVVKREITLNDQVIPYEITTGKLPLKSDDGKKLADVFYIAYTKIDAEPKERPVTFAFNGGPGSSSVWLHLGMLDQSGFRFAMTPNRRHRLRQCRQCLLHARHNDLVFIDPVSTGYSRPAEEIKKDEFHGYDEDLRSVGQFIHDYTSQYKRWLSPKFLMGESYGGVRAAGLSGYLQDRYNMELNGLVIVSGVINFRRCVLDQAMIWLTSVFCQATRPLLGITVSSMKHVNRSQ